MDDPCLLQQPSFFEGGRESSEASEVLTVTKLNMELDRLESDFSLQ